MAASPAESAARFEHDLRRIRDAHGISLSDVQHDTRIPVDVLERFEAGRLIGDPHFNEVYLRALVRAYADAVGVPSAEVTRAYEQQKAGTYAGALKTFLGEPASAAEPDSPVEPPPDSSEEETAAMGAASGAPPAVTALRSAPSNRPDPAPVRPKSQEKVRVQTRNQAAATGTPIDTSWGLIIGATLVGVLVIGAILWFLLREEGPTPIEEPAMAPTAADTVAQAPAVAQHGPDMTGAPQVQLPLTVTVIAQESPLTGFRVTAAPDVRRPYWIEQGIEQTFQSPTEIILWGEQRGDGHVMPAHARFRMQGYTWAPAGQGPIRIDQQRGQAILDSLHRSGVQQGAQPGAPQPVQAQPGAPVPGAPGAG
jgi:hypothetical protein